MLGDAPCAPASYFWPGDQDMGWFDFLDAASYPLEIAQARASADHLADFLQVFSRQCAGVSVSLVGHSLGCRLLLEALHVLLTRQARLPITNLFLMAPAVPVELLTPGAPLANALNLAQRCVVLFSSADWVLRFAFPVGQATAEMIGTEPRPAPGAVATALGLVGPPSFMVAESLPLHDNTHGQYWKDRRAADRLSQLLHGAPPAVLATHGTQVHEIADAHELPANSIEAREIDPTCANCK